MHIKFVEISNFRRLQSVRIELTEETTLFVGANNCGKTSAMEALRLFLVVKRFSINDFTLSHWARINSIGNAWQAFATAEEVQTAASPTEWESILPTLDLWFHVEKNEIHHVSRLLPTLDWRDGLLGVRLRYEPSDVAKMAADYLGCHLDAQSTKTQAKEAEGDEVGEVKLWPQSLLEYLERRLHNRFAIKTYALDPAMCVAPENGIAKPQLLPMSSEAIEDNPLDRLVRVNEINAQRGLGQGARNTESGDPRRVTDQVRHYWDHHLDPSDRPMPSDLVAMRAIEKAQELFDKTLNTTFADTLAEVGDFGYPGQTDPEIKISARISATDTLNHDAAVQYEVAAVTGEGEATTVLRLPEHYNGLGYQNLILMFFRLVSFRDSWMRKGKMGRSGTLTDADVVAPLHLVLIEEPEAHLHAQVQQVFIRKAYKTLRRHEQLGDKKVLRTQLVVSTHSSHVAHEAKFSWLRYFRRLPASKIGAVPTSTVINLSDVFGSDKETERFDTRYLRSTHCDLFFADAAILVEGPAEKILVPHFIRSHFDYLTQCYLSLLEIGGSHAHRLRPLIEKMGLLTLVVTDLDSENDAGSHEQPARGKGLKTGNTTLKEWLPALAAVDDLFEASEESKTRIHDQIFSVRAAYQCPIIITLDEKQVEVLPSTFEDALAFANLASFAEMEKVTGLMEKFRKAIVENKSGAALSKALYDHLHTNAKKAEFALDLLEVKDPEKLIVPSYLAEGLGWLQSQLRRKHIEILPPSIVGDVNSKKDAV